jgi:serine/threonine protein kinase
MELDASIVDGELIGITLADRYEILSLIGHGGMGSVYKARHVSLDKLVAVKVLQARYLTDPSNHERFEREAKALSSLMHSNVVSVIDYGFSQQGAPYLVMDFLEGSTLAELIKRENHIEEVRAVRIFIQIARALNHIHSRGVLHRDLKPSNIMLLNNESETDLVKIMDFGISRRTDFKQEKGEITQKGQLVGSPLYMSPEQCLGRELDERSDIYSLGCLMYEALIGMPPLVGTTPIQTVFKQSSENPLPFKEKRPAVSVSSDLERVVLKALEKNPENRYRNAKELTDDLELFNRRKEQTTALQSNKVEDSDRERLWASEKNDEGSKESTALIRSRKVSVLIPILFLSSIICLLVLIFAYFCTVTGSIARGKIDLFLQKRFFHASDKKILQSLNELADTCMENQLYQDAKPLYERAATLTDQVFGINSPQSVLAHCNCVQVCLKKDGLKAATKMFETDVKPVFLKVLGPLMQGNDNLEVANLATPVLNLEKLLHMKPCLDGRGLYELAARYQRLGMYDVAEPLYEKALAETRWRSGPKSSLVGEILLGLGDLYAQKGEFEQAVTEYNKASSIFSPGSFEDVVRLLHTANAERNNEASQRAQAQAEALYKRALSLEGVRGFKDGKIPREILLDYAALLRRNDRVPEAKYLEKRAAEISAPQSTR